MNHFTAYTVESVIVNKFWTKDGWNFFLQDKFELKRSSQMMTNPRYFREGGGGGLHWSEVKDRWGPAIS